MAGPLHARLSELSAALAALVLPARGWACAVCIGSGDGQQPGIAGFWWSALLLTALPFAVVLTIGGVVGYGARRARRSPRPSSPPPTPPAR